MERHRRPAAALSLLAFAVAFTASPGARAANYDPRIAYTSYEGKGDTLYLANADGSLKVAVYKTNKTTISGLDLGNGRVAFTESGVLKVLSYVVTATGITATAPLTLDATGAPYQGAAWPDFSPDGSQLLYLRWVQDPVAGTAGYREVRLIPSNGSAAPKVLLTNTQLSSTSTMTSPRWLSANEFAFGREGGSPYSLAVLLGSLDANFDLTALPLELFNNSDPGFTSLGVVGWEDFDIAHTGTSILISANPPGSGARTFIQFDLVGHTFTPRFSDYGWKAHFQEGDASVVYAHVPSGGVTIANAVYRWVAATNRATAISGKGSLVIRFVDARP